MAVHTDRIFADFYDGHSALRQRVALRHDADAYGDMLQLGLPDGEHILLWPLARLRSLQDQSLEDLLVLGLGAGEPSRLMVRDPRGIKLVSGLCPNLRQPIPGPPIWRRAIGVAAGGIALVALLFFVFLPGLAGLLASQIDAKVEERMGQQVFDSIVGPPPEGMSMCVDPAGMRAFRALADRVSAGVALPYPLKIAVLDDSEEEVLNAYALAGGHIIFNNSMLQAAETPEEIAAVFAHELGHIVNQDVVRGMLQSSTVTILTVLLSGDIFGGLGVGGGYLNASYSRGVETAADDFAHDQLRAVDLPPSALGVMFERLRARNGDVGGLFAHFSSHPQLAERIAAAGEAPSVPFRPVLSPAQWQDLRKICAQTRADPTLTP